jgi:GT2 family glycosyltransferase
MQTEVSSLSVTNNLLGANPSVTIVMSVADRFSCTPKTIDTILSKTEYPFELIFVDGNAPRHIRQYLDDKVAKKQIKVARSENYLSPSQSRNLGASVAAGDYILFIDNDVYVSSGWLEALINCAKETDADLITPLVCIGEPLAELIHLAGGETYIEVKDVDQNKDQANSADQEADQISSKNQKNPRRLYVKHHFANRPLNKTAAELVRQKCSLVDLHCILVKKSVFEAIQGFDETLLNTREHVDFCLRVQEQNFSIYCEPSSVVTYVPGDFATNLKWSDVPYFSLRWSDFWERKSLNRFVEKWNLTEDNYFKMRFKNLGKYRQDALLKPLFLKLRRYRMSVIERKLAKWERALNNYFYSPKTML